MNSRSCDSNVYISLHKSAAHKLRNSDFNKRQHIAIRNISSGGLFTLRKQRDIQKAEHMHITSFLVVFCVILPSHYVCVMYSKQTLSYVLMMSDSLNVNVSWLVAWSVGWLVASLQVDIVQTSHQHFCALNVVVLADNHRRLPKFVKFDLRSLKELLTGTKASLLATHISLEPLDGFSKHPCSVRDQHLSCNRKDLRRGAPASDPSHCPSDVSDPKKNGSCKTRLTLETRERHTTPEYTFSHSTFCHRTPRDIYVKPKKTPFKEEESEANA
uniref:Uncharacterized protein n=1 Tax=Glossina pallidipes TaxID=7398 RepID=A0A1A9ZJJ1_GLOPL